MNTKDVNPFWLSVLKRGFLDKVEAPGRSLRLSPYKCRS